MKIKLLSFAVLSSILLSACGGGSSGSDSNTGGSTGGGSTSGSQQWTSYEIGTTATGPNQEKMVIDKDVTTIKDGKTYYKNTNSLNLEDMYSITVTASGLYDDVNAPVDNTLGRLIGTTTIQNNRWSFTPYSSIGSKDLTLNTQYKTIDLSGKPLLQFLAPADYLIITKGITNIKTIDNTTLNFYKTFANATFPAGSTCMQVQSMENNAEHLELYADLTDQDEQNYYKEQWNDYRVSQHSILKNMKDTTAYLQSEDDETTGYALYKNQYYGADLVTKGSEFNINDYKKLLDAYYKDKKDTAELLKTALDSSCHYYNPTAAQSISTAVKF